MKFRAILCAAAAAAIASTASPADAGTTKKFRSQVREMQGTAQYRAARAAFQKVAGARILADGVMDVWTAAVGEIADSSCDATVAHPSWGKLSIPLSYAVCDHLNDLIVQHGVLLSPDKRYLGLVLVDPGGNSGKAMYQLVIFKRTSTPIEGGRDDYYRKIKSQWF